MPPRHFSRITYRPGQQRGILILEAGIAFILVSIGIVGLVMLAITGSRSTQESVERTDAINIATQVVVRVRTAGTSLLEWDGVDVVDSATWNTSDATSLAALGAMKQHALDRLDDPHVTITLREPGTLNPCAASPCEMDVAVRWMGASRRARSYSMSGYSGLQ